MEGLLGAREALMRALTVIVLFALASPGLACINTFASQILEARGQGNDALVAEIAAKAEVEHRAAPTLENTNDLAVAWILTGRIPDGIRLLRELEKTYPGNAIVAANLGTALELAGADEEALQWIRESVRRDPREHQGSEWVHVRILEAKIALKRDPSWLRKNAVVGWREGDRLPLDERSRVRTPDEILHAIEYQLRERTQFVRAPDPIVGDLYRTMGDLAHSVPGAVADSRERDRIISSSYHSALYYGVVDEGRARERMAAAEQRREAALPALRAAAASEQAARQRELDRERAAAKRKQDLIDAQEKRRWMALAAFGTFGVVVAGVFYLRGRRRRAEPA